MPVYWKPRYAGRGQRHRAWVRQELKRDAALPRPERTLRERLLSWLRR